MNKNNLPLLYSFRRCPFAIRARMSLWLANVQVHVYEIALKEKPEEMLKLSPKGTVPVLLLSNGQVIDESLDIMKYTVTEADNTISISSHLNHVLCQENDTIFKPLLDAYKYHIRYEKTPEHYRDKARELYLDKLEEKLANSTFLLGKSADLLDIAIFPFVRQFASVNLDWFDKTLPNLNRWLNDWKNSDCFKDIMKKYPVNTHSPL